MSIIFVACTQEKTAPAFTFKNGKAVSLVIPRRLISAINVDSIRSQLKVYVGKSHQTPILGDIRVDGQSVVFTPVLHFSTGQHYYIFAGNNQLAHVSIPSSKTNSPQVLQVFPSVDTLPENLLKVYIAFSHPMREGVAAKNLFLLGPEGDTIKDIFLELHPELWNETMQVYTAWLDPGRIKRGLIPNSKLGNPLQANHSYTILVGAGWEDENGVPMEKEYRKTFVATTRDSLKPDVQKWILGLPMPGKRDPMTINFKEPLDNFLVYETIKIRNEDGSEVAGQLYANTKTMCWFKPSENWKAGNYLIQVDSKLEDLAGNNLQKVFDRDTWKNEDVQDVAYFERKFEIKKWIKE